MTSTRMSGPAETGERMYETPGESGLRAIAAAKRVMATEGGLRDARNKERRSLESKVWDPNRKVSKPAKKGR